MHLLPSTSSFDTVTPTTASWETYIGSEHPKPTKPLICTTHFIFAHSFHLHFNNFCVVLLLIETSLIGSKNKDFKYNQTVNESSLNMHKSIPAPAQQRRRGSLFKERLLLISPEIAFIGDSILAKFAEEGQDVWEKHYSPLNSGNMGTVGDSTQMLVEKLERDMVPLEETQIVILMIGATDLRHKLKVSVVFEQIRKIVQLLQAGCRSSGVKIIVLGVLPRGDSNVDCNDAIAETNELLTGLENGFTVRFVSLESKFFDKEQNKIKEHLFNSDRINLNPQGYEVLADAISPVLQECLASK